ncbi:GntR family transcriptional regulator [Globicatella sp. PHS-GS-PNBC-21-1553]|uniref:GntR family transcriptional regulator n=1 Tax=Globicatella sp. PHS-GS-PNBC-21-1553 TaxID=2885764 RepID=UPI00298F2636|nr:GntR family transcriptional regulator [Globicatella sp. PHS-GS-PNBC-21-1553]WPC09625.1 GntR family transcriptional regulator [Globicatella sp. PHS-GS-PNBC-21-1553]
MSLPKYQQIAEVLREEIIKGTYAVGNVIPTEAKLQEQFDVSRHTIRQALSILINEGYLRSEKGSGTYVKNRLIESTNNNSTRKIGVITTYLSDYIFPNIIRGIEEVLRQNNYSLVLASTDNDIVQEEICLKRMLDEEVAGLIVEPTKSNLFNPNIAYYSKFKELGIPILFINAYYENTRFTVYCDG